MSGSFGPYPVLEQELFPRGYSNTDNGTEQYSVRRRLYQYRSTIVSIVIDELCLHEKWSGRVPCSTNEEGGRGEIVSAM